MRYQIDVGRLLEEFGGAKSVCEALNGRWGAADPVSPIAVLRWQQRNSIPANRLAEILMLAKQRGTPIDVMGLIVEGRPDAA